MTATLVSVASAIVTELGSVTLSEAFMPIRSYAVWDDLLSDVDGIGLRVDVVPASCPSELLTRSKHQYTCTVSVLLRKLFTDADRAQGKIVNAKVDVLVADLQTIHEYFAPSQPTYSGRRLTAMPTAAWFPASGIKAPYSRKMLREHGQFSGWVSLVYGVPKAIA